MKKEFNQSDVECSDQNKRRTVYVTSTFVNFEDANEACDKYGMNSIADNFKVRLHEKGFLWVIKNSQRLIS